MSKTYRHRLDHDIKQGGLWIRSYSITEQTNVRSQYMTLSGYRYSKMLERCKEGGREQRLHKTYVGTTNGFRDFQEFVEWSMAEYGYNLKEPRKDSERYYSLEKDLLGKGSKIYSPETCLLVPAEVNTFICLSNSTRGQYPIGVAFIARQSKFMSQCQNGHNSKRTQGLFDTPFEAHIAWQKAKVAYGRSLCDKYKEHTKMVEGLSAWLDKIEQDRLTGRESVFL